MKVDIKAPLDDFKRRSNKDIQLADKEESLFYPPSEEEWLRNKELFVSVKAVNVFLQDCASNTGFFCMREGNTWELQAFPGQSIQVENLIVEKDGKEILLKIFGEHWYSCVIDENNLKPIFESLERILSKGEKMRRVLDDYGNKQRSRSGGNKRAENYANFKEVVYPLIEQYLNQEKLSGKKINNTDIARWIKPTIDGLIDLGEMEGRKSNVQKRIGECVRTLRNK